jgi:hypothetical protein
MHTLGTAANATGLNRSTVLRAIKSGKISAAKNEHGEWQSLLQMPRGAPARSNDTQRPARRTQRLC